MAVGLGISPSPFPGTPWRDDGIVMAQALATVFPLSVH